MYKLIGIEVVPTVCRYLARPKLHLSGVNFNSIITYYGRVVLLSFFRTQYSVMRSIIISRII